MLRSLAHSIRLAEKEISRLYILKSTFEDSIRRAEITIAISRKRLELDSFKIELYEEIENLVCEDTHKLVLLKRYIENLSIKEISKQLNYSNRHLSRILKIYE